MICRYLQLSINAQIIEPPLGCRVTRRQKLRIATFLNMIFAWHYSLLGITVKLNGHNTAKIMIPDRTLIACRDPSRRFSEDSGWSPAIKRSPASHTARVFRSPRHRF